MTNLENRVRQALTDEMQHAPSAAGVRDRFWAQASKPSVNKSRAGLLVPLTIVAVTLIVVGLGVLAGGFTSGEAPVDPTTADAPNVDQSSKLVGRGSVAVAVPSEWSTNDAVCGVAMSDTVTFEKDGFRLCEIPSPPLVSSVGITGIQSRVGQSWIKSAEVTTDLDGHEMLVSTMAHNDPFYNQVVAVPDLDFVMSVRSPMEATIDGIVGSLQVLDAPYVALPDVRGMTVERAETALADLGLSARAALVSDEGNVAGRVASTKPLMGTVLHRGDSVILQVPTPH